MGRKTQAAGPEGTRLTRGVLSFFEFGSMVFAMVIAFLFLITALSALLGYQAEAADSATGTTNLSRYSVVYTKDVPSSQLTKGDLFLGSGDYAACLYVVREKGGKQDQFVIASADDPNGKTVTAVLSSPVKKAAVIVKGAGVFYGAVDGNSLDREVMAYFLILGAVLIAGIPITRSLMRMQDAGRQKTE